MDVDASSGFASTWYPAAQLRSQATLVNLSSGNDVSALVFQMKKTASITGVVTVPVGTIGGVSTVTVTVRTSSEPGPNDQSVNVSLTPAADGSFRLTNLAPGSYSVTYTARPESGLIDVNDPTQYVWLAPGSERKLATTMKGSGSITGLVTVPQDDAIHSVTVYLYDAQQKVVAQAGIIDDYNGDYYRFDNVAAGDYRVLFDSLDRGEMVDKWYDKGYVFSAAKVVTVAPGQKVTGIDATLTRAASMSGTVTLPSTVTWKDTTVKVTVHSVSSGAVWTRSTNSTGGYRVTGLPPGTYRVEYTPSSATLKGEWWNDKPDYARATDITLAYTQQLKRVDVALASTTGPAPSPTPPPSAGWSISGRLAAPSGAALPSSGVSVSVFEGWNTGPAVTTVAVGPSGEFAFAGLQARGYRLRVNADASTGLASTWYSAGQVRSMASIVNLSSGRDVTGLVFQAKKTASISGVVTVPVGTIGGSSTVTVTARTAAYGQLPSDEMVELRTTAAADGSFRFAGLIPGSYSVSYAARPESGLRDVRLSSAIYAEAGSDQKLTQTMVGTGSIAGQVTVPAGRYPTSVTVYLYDAQQRVVAKTPVRDAYNGNFFSFENVAAGDFRVLFGSSDAGEMVDKWYDRGYVFSAAKVVAVAPGQKVGGIDTTLTRAASISGTVALPSTATWKNTKVTVSVHNVTTGVVWNRTTNAQGGYRVTGLPPGTYRVKYIPSSATLKSEWWNDKPDYARATNIALAYNQQLKRVDVALATATARSLF
ncbi:MAG: hypothetical protein K0S37_1367 [Microbacterium sp.]|jgi:hypothetical protein|nr:hypothetical protein [Microbacterium sp.]